ncbi:MAG: hypothetical protein AW12_01794 [Candidatus Accumulibacter sp. BA-94]|nr:MAG: hypothetical protein AW12_01794 [Candidatus Accumulibacter sp. BA-94]
MGSMNELMAQARHRLSVNDFHRMGEAGILLPESRVELIEGEIVDMAPIGSKHAFVLNRLAQFFAAAAGDRYLVSVQNPLCLDQHSEPQPDIVLLRPDNYMERLPGAIDALLVVEVAHSSVHFDRGVKLPLYARHGIPEVWLLDLMGGELLICREPVEDQYRVVHKPRARDEMTPLLVPEVKWRLGDGKTWSVPY